MQHTCREIYYPINIVYLKQIKMVLLLLGDSQVERIWPSVRLDRELLRDAIFIPVKNQAAVADGFRSITASVRLN